MSPRPSKSQIGKYTLIERLSYGGMAEVFRAKSTGEGGFEREVAIKILLPQVASDQEFVTMLIDEAKIAAQLGHSNIAQTFDLGVEDGRYYIVQEHVSGWDLRRLQRHLADQQQRLDLRFACHIAIKICEGLEYIHTKRDVRGMPLNLVHRDISPQNVMLSHEGEVKLIDFGIVKAEGRATRTVAGSVKGKFAYMAPEQFRGLPLDKRADVFACGIVFHELLTGAPLFKRPNEFDTLQRARNGDIAPPSQTTPGIPPEIDRIALKALERHADDRYQSAQAMRDDLWQWVREADAPATSGELAAWLRASVPSDKPEVHDIVEDGEPPEKTASEHAYLPTPLPRPVPLDFEDVTDTRDLAFGNVRTTLDADLQRRMLATFAASNGELTSPTRDAGTQTAPIAPQAGHRGRPMPPEEPAPLRSPTGSGTFGSGTASLPEDRASAPEAAFAPPPWQPTDARGAPAPQSVADRRRTWLIAGAVAVLVAACIATLALALG